jgi:Ni/Co efflux regulator RcnB
MKKLFITLGAILAFGIASAQTATTRTKNTTSRTQKAKTTDTRTTTEKKRNAERNASSLQQNNTIPTPPASAPGSVNTNSSAMPQVTPPVSSPPPGAPMTPQPVGTPIRKPQKQ